jgi:hypothetical protein
LRLEGESLVDKRAPGEPSLLPGGKAQWMHLPAEVLSKVGPPAKRYIIREYQSACPRTGKMVRTVELEGGLWCWETPGVGFTLANCPDPDPRVTEVQQCVEDAQVEKEIDGPISVVRTKDQGVVSTDLTGGLYRLSARAQLWIQRHMAAQGRQADILVICPEALDGWVEEGYLRKRDGVYYLAQE